MKGGEDDGNIGTATTLEFIGGTLCNLDRVSFCENIACQEIDGRKLYVFASRVGEEFFLEHDSDVFCSNVHDKGTMVTDIELSHLASCSCCKTTTLTID